MCTGSDGLIPPAVCASVKMEFFFRKHVRFDWKFAWYLECLIACESDETHENSSHTQLETTRAKRETESCCIESEQLAEISEIEKKHNGVMAV